MKMKIKPSEVYRKNLFGWMTKNECLKKIAGSVIQNTVHEKKKKNPPSSF